MGMELYDIASHVPTLYQCCTIFTGVFVIFLDLYRHAPTLHTFYHLSNVLLKNGEQLEGPARQILLVHIHI